MTVVIIVLCSLILIGLIVAIILLIKRKPIVNGNYDNKEIGSLENQIKSLQESINKDITILFSKEMNNFLLNNLKNNEANNDKLERFQSNITESLAKRFDALNAQMNERLNDINKKVDEKLAEGFKGTSESMAQVRERLVAIDTAQKNIENLSKDVVSLKSVLEGNQSRGAYGELQLELILDRMFNSNPALYSLQYSMPKIKDGERVRADAVVFLPEPNKMICIDSKFPFANYSRLFEDIDEYEKETLIKAFQGDIKKHITDIKEKYIIYGKTAPNAMMFIPNDGIFAFIHHNCYKLVEDARENGVVITSPSTLPPILHTINMIRIEIERNKNVKIISTQLAQLGKEFSQFATEWSKFSSQLETATRSREKLDSRVSKINTKFDAIKSSDSESSAEIEEKEESVDNDLSI